MSENKAVVNGLDGSEMAALLNCWTAAGVEFDVEEAVNFEGWAVWVDGPAGALEKAYFFSPAGELVGVNF